MQWDIITNAQPETWTTNVVFYANEPSQRRSSRQQRRIADEIIDRVRRIRDSFADAMSRSEEDARIAALDVANRDDHRAWLNVVLRAEEHESRPDAPVEHARTVAIRRIVLRASARGVRNYRARRTA